MAHFIVHLPMHRIFGLFITLFIFSSSVFSQPPLYPRNYFRWPLDLKPEIVANLGELRNNHWHMGLDIRTAQRENIPVYAAAGGYIARVRIEPFGFGRSIYINHPNGLTTLYAHLNDFNPALEKFVTAQQYEKQTWAIDLSFTPQQFPVSKGSLIAYSGNTGGSQGPHVHFEIRDTKTDKCLNPLLFGMPLADNVPPTLVKLALYDRSTGIYEQRPQLYTLSKSGNSYIIPKMPVIKTASEKISFAIQAYDRISGSNNQDGIYSARLFVDETAVAGFIIDSISYEETGYMNAHIDFTHKYKGGAWLQHISPLPGDYGPVYKLFNGDGIVHLQDTEVHAVRLEIKDAYGNTSVARFSVQRSNGLQALNEPTAQTNFSPGLVNIFEKPGFEVYMPENCFYDTIAARYHTTGRPGSGALSPVHALNDPSIPVHGSFTVRIRPDEAVPAKWNEKLIVLREYGGKRTVKKARYENGFLVADFADFGNFQAFLDLEPPTINELGKGDTVNLSAASRIVFYPGDNFAVKSFRAELDGQWLRFTNDKGRAHIYRFDEKCPDGVHHLKVTVEDMVGNTTTKSWWFKKYPYTPPPKKKVAGKTSGHKTGVKKKAVKKR